MRTVGIIVEYNPLHNGHVYHYRQSKIAANADACIAVISGHFLQRGEPALVNKWARAEMALRMGVDLVIELPAAYASSPAEWFAFGAVAVLDSTGVVDDLCFGSELGDIAPLQHLAKQLAHEPADFRKLVQSNLKQGVNFPAAYSGAIQSYIVDRLASEDAPTHALNAAHPPTEPNNILGLHYLIALERLNSHIRPLTITRSKAGYHQQDITDGQIASATAIRRLLFEESNLEAVRPFVPTYTMEILQREWLEGRAPIGWESFALPLFHSIMSRTPAELEQIQEVEEGLEFRLKQVLPLLSRRQPLTVEELLQHLKTKRYTRTKLQRMLLRILLNHRKPLLAPLKMSQGPDYLRVLGFNGKGRELLRRMRKTCRVPLVHHVSRARSDMLDMDTRATKTYALAYRNPTPFDALQDYYQPPLRME